MRVEHEPDLAATGDAHLDFTPLPRLAASACVSRGLAVIARLGIADLVAERPLTPAELAERTASNPDALDWLLRTLAEFGIFEQTPGGGFRLAEQCAPLRTEHPRSLRNFVILMAEVYGDAFAGLEYTVRTGKPGFDEVFGTSLYDYLAGEPDAERIFDQAMAELARPTLASFLDTRDFTGVRTVVDVGGGNGETLAAILTRYPQITGICLDRPTTCARAGALPRPGGVAGRLTFQAGNIFDDVPEGGDRYLLKNVLHDFPEDLRLRILGAVRRAMLGTTGATRLHVLEPLVNPAANPAHGLFQMVCCGEGTHGFRTPGEVRTLLERARFTVCSVDRLPTGHLTYDCVPDEEAGR